MLIRLISQSSRDRAKVSKFLEFNDPLNYTVSSQEGRRQRVSQLLELNVLSSAQNNLRNQKRKGQSVPGVKCAVNRTEQSQEGRRERISQFLELNVLSSAQNNLRNQKRKDQSVPGVKCSVNRTEQSQ